VLAVEAPLVGRRHPRDERQGAPRGRPGLCRHRRSV
jgi:hypothetical protein